MNPLPDVVLSQTTSAYKITNYVFNEIYLTCSFHFLLQLLQHLNLFETKRAKSNKLCCSYRQDHWSVIYGAKITGVGGGEEVRTNPYKNYASSPEDF
jgi:hypothetical protein